MIVAMILFALLSFHFNMVWSPANLWIAIMFCHLPDADMIPYLILKRKLPIQSHWVIGHHPILFIPTSFGVTWYMTDNPFYLVMSIIGPISHFLHDMMNPAGLHVLSPFIWNRVTLYDHTPRILAKREWMRIFLRRSTRWKGDTLKQLKGRAEQISTLQLFIWICAFLSVLVVVKR